MTGLHVNMDDPNNLQINSSTNIFNITNPIFGFQLQVEHPAAKMMILGSQMQEQEVGDGTNFVIILAGALLEQAESLIRMGLTPTGVAEGFEKALKKGGNQKYVIKELPNLNHLFQEASTGSSAEYSIIQQTLSPLLLNEITNFLKQKTNLP